MKTNFLSTDRKTIIITVLIIAGIQTAFTILAFNILKKGYEGDEVYSYATANSSQTMNPLLDKDGTIHINEWLSSKQLFQAIVVSKNEILNYDHINEILMNDAHPPLYFYLLHFFSSLIVDRFSWIPSIVINSLSYFIGQIFFYRLFLLISRDRFQSIIAMTFFGCTSAAINMMTFARNYTLLTSLTLMFTFYLFRSMYQQSIGEKNKKSIVLAALFLYLAALTQYLSILFGFFITLSVSVYYLIKKNVRSMLETGLFMTGSIVLMILSFQEVIHQLFIDQTSMENATDYPFWLELRISVHILFNELFGINTSVYPTMFFFWVFWGMVGILIIYLIMKLLFRSDLWFTNTEKKLYNMLKTIPQKLTNHNIFQYFSLLFVTIIFVCIISYKFKIYFYYPNSNRYLFLIYPYCVIILLFPILLFLKYQHFQLIFLISLSCLSLLSGKKTNIDSAQMTMSEAVQLLENSDVVVFIPSYFDANNSILYMEKTNKVFYTTNESFVENSNLFINNLSNTRPLYLMYYWPTYNNNDTNSDMLEILKTLDNLGITTINDNPEYHGAQPIAGLSGHILLRLR